MLAASGSCLLCKKLGSAFTAAGLDLALALPACGTCSLPGSVLRNEGWRRGFVEVTYTERCVCLFDYGMLHADRADMTSIYTVQTVESCNFSEWPTLPDLCSAVFQAFRMSVFKLFFPF